MYANVLIKYLLLFITSLALLSLLTTRLFPGNVSLQGTTQADVTGKQGCRKKPGKVNFIMCINILFLQLAEQKTCVSKFASTLSAAGSTWFNAEGWLRVCK